MRCLASGITSKRPAGAAVAAALLAAASSTRCSAFAPATDGTVRFNPAPRLLVVSPPDHGRGHAGPTRRLSLSYGPTDPHASSNFVMDPRSAEARKVTSGMGIDPSQHDALTELASLVVEWNERINLISRKECTEEVVFGRHVLPSAALCALKDSPLGRLSPLGSEERGEKEGSSLETMTVAELKEMLKKEGKPVSGKKAELIERLRSRPSSASTTPSASTGTDGRRIKVADVGTGGGFPGLPLAILYPHVDFILIDSVGKKLKVVEDMSKKMGLQNVNVHHGRVEELVDDPLEGKSHRGAYDAVLGRSVTSLPRFCFWVSELLRKKQVTGMDDGHDGNEGKLLYIIGGEVEESVVSRVQSDKPIDDLLNYIGASDKRVLILAASDVERVAAESGEVKKVKRKRMGTSKSKGGKSKAGQGRGAKGEWKKKDNAAPKQRGYENFKRYNG